jgi:hypothetical protein
MAELNEFFFVAMLRWKAVYEVPTITIVMQL